MLSTDIQDTVAQEFDCLRGVVFLSSSFTTMPPRCVQKAYTDFLDKWLSIFPNDEWWGWSKGIGEQGRQEVAKLLHCAAEDIAFVKNTTEGIGIIASGYPWQKGKNIVIPEQEHYACLHSWIPLPAKGVPLKPVMPKNQQKGMTADDIIDMMDDDTQAVVTSVVQFWDGAFIDMEKLGRTCRERNVLLIVDAIQAVGRMDVDVKKWNIDWLSCGSHKGLLSMEGGGIVYCNPDLADKVIPPYIGMESATTRSHIMEPGGMRVDFKPGAARFEGGCVNTSGVMCITEACRMLNAIGMKNIERHILDLQEFCLQKLGDDSKRVRIMGERPSGIIMLDFPEEKRADVLNILNKSRINATVRPNNVRFCISFFNTQADMEILAKAIKEMQQVQVF